MRPLVPVNNRAFLQRYVKAGASEFYLGFHDETWFEGFGVASDLNRMSGFGAVANPYEFADVIDVAREVHQLGAQLYVTFNANTYSVRQLDCLRVYFERLARAQVAGVIVSVPEAISAAAEFGLIPVASTMMGAYNVEVVKCLAQRGCKRVVLPRDLGLDEIESIIKAQPHMEYEVFVMRNGCIFSDGYCLGRHGSGGNALCWDVRDASRTNHLIEYDEARAAQLRQELEENAQAYTRFHRNTCGLCALWRLLRAGVGSAKIVGRSDDPSYIVSDIEAVVANARIARTSATEDEYLRRMEIPPHRVQGCHDSLSCYYPEVRFP